ncbi:MAG: YHYH protein [Alphaproteobacteria bacterium]|nr:MAG: YHYH protein [Alphaproteobacteria bacterium]
MRYVMLFLCCLMLLPAAALAHGTHDDHMPHGQFSLMAILANKVTLRQEGDYLVMQGNGVPNHSTGQFPGPENPHAISEQDYKFRIPAHPQKAQAIIPLTNRMDFGVALNGVPFDPGTAEYWRRDRNSGWVEEGIVNGKHRLGIDQNGGHVQPNGAYHYHAMPADLVKGEAVHIGYAADGYKIYAAPPGSYTSSYQLKSGTRPANSPAGKYDGTYTQDFTYVEGSGDLGRCNEMELEGESVYMLTESFPFVPRCWIGEPDRSFEKSPPGGSRGFGGSRGGRPPPPRGVPPRF